MKRTRERRQGRTRDRWNSAAQGILQAALLAFLCIAVAIPAGAAESVPDLPAVPGVPEVPALPEPGERSGMPEMKGRWEGIIEGSFRSQAVSWRFEIGDDGMLQGYMGPRAAGMPTVPMRALKLEDGRISFEIPDQHAAFEGTLDGDGVGGTWTQGTAFPLRMKKKIFAFALGPRVREGLLGEWSAELRGKVIKLHFSEQPDATVSGMLGLPDLGRGDIPLVDLFIEERGYAKFATDEGSSFTGRFVNDVLVGDYRVGGRTYKLAFQRPERLGRPFTLELSDVQWRRVEGVWKRKGGRGPAFHFQRLPSGEPAGYLAVSRREEDPVLSLELDGEAVGLLTLGGRSFNGSLRDGVMSGQYRVRSRPGEAEFVRQEAEPEKAGQEE